MKPFERLTPTETIRVVRLFPDLIIELLDPLICLLEYYKAEQNLVNLLKIRDYAADWDIDPQLIFEAVKIAHFA